MGGARHFRLRFATARQAVRAAIGVRTSGRQRTPMNREPAAALPRFVPVVIEKWYNRIQDCVKTRSYFLNNYSCGASVTSMNHHTGLDRAHPDTPTVVAAIPGCRIARLPAGGLMWKRGHDVGSVLWPGRQGCRRLRQARMPAATDRGQCPVAPLLPHIQKQCFLSTGNQLRMFPASVSDGLPPGCFKGHPSGDS